MNNDLTTILIEMQQIVIKLDSKLNKSNLLIEEATKRIEKIAASQNSITNYVERNIFGEESSLKNQLKTIENSMRDTTLRIKEIELEIINIIKENDYMLTKIDTDL